MKKAVSYKGLKIVAILDFVFDILLIGSVWVLLSNNNNLKAENTSLTNEVSKYENQIIEKDNYIDYLENVIIEAKIFEK